MEKKKRRSQVNLVPEDLPCYDLPGGGEKKTEDVPAEKTHFTILLYQNVIMIFLSSFVLFCFLGGGRRKYYIYIFVLGFFRSFGKGWAKGQLINMTKILCLFLHQLDFRFLFLGCLISFCYMIILWFVCSRINLSKYSVSVLQIPGQNTGS